MCDMLGNVARKLATANVFMAKDGVVMTPIANGSFLSGVTRQRVLELLRADGKDAREATSRFADFDAAPSIRCCRRDNGQVRRQRDRRAPSCSRARFFTAARKLYWEFAHA